MPRSPEESIKPYSPEWLEVVMGIWCWGRPVASSQSDFTKAVPILLITLFDFWGLSKKISC